jgi:hypothetical protein
LKPDLLLFDESWITFRQRSGKALNIDIFFSEKTCTLQKKNVSQTSAGRWKGSGPWGEFIAKTRGGAKTRSCWRRGPSFNLRALVTQSCVTWEFKHTQLCPGIPSTSHTIQN